MTVHPEEDVKVRTRFHGSSCGEISLKTTYVNLVVVPEGKSGDHQSHYGSSSGDNECLYNISLKSIK